MERGRKKGKNPCPANRPPGKVSLRGEEREGFKARKEGMAFTTLFGTKTSILPPSPKPATSSSGKPKITPIGPEKEKGEL